jgi:hypothetical protein
MRRPPRKSREIRGMKLGRNRKGWFGRNQGRKRTLCAYDKIKLCVLQVDFTVEDLFNCLFQSGKQRCQPDKHETLPAAYARSHAADNGNFCVRLPSMVLVGSWNICGNHCPLSLPLLLYRLGGILSSGAARFITCERGANSEYSNKSGPGRGAGHQFGGRLPVVVIVAQDSLGVDSAQRHVFPKVEMVPILRLWTRGRLSCAFARR